MFCACTVCGCTKCGTFLYVNFFPHVDLIDLNQVVGPSGKKNFLFKNSSFLVRGFLRHLLKFYEVKLEEMEKAVFWRMRH